MILVASRPRLYAIATVVPLAAVGAALVTQHLFDMQPCPWCILQRLIFVAIALSAMFGLLGLQLRLAIANRAATGLIALLAMAGVATALWQHFVAAVSTSCNLTLADRIVSGLGVDALWPQVFAAYASCADAAATLLGVPYEFYSLTLFIVLGMLAVALLRQRA